jgi:hypothetical protein
MDYSQEPRIMVLYAYVFSIDPSASLYVLQGTNPWIVSGSVTVSGTVTVSGNVTVIQSDETKLKATVTQAAKDRSISSVDAVSTPTSITATALGDTTIDTPASGKKFRVKLIDVWNNGSADITVYLKFAAGGTARFKKLLAAKTGFVVNLVGCNWEGTADQALIINLSAAGTVDVTVFRDSI